MGDGLSGGVGDGAAEGRKDGGEREEGLGAELAGTRPERRERLPEQASLEARRHAGHRGDVGHQPLRVAADAPRRMRPRPRWLRGAPPLQDLGPPRLVGAEQLLDELGRLPEGHAGAGHHPRGRRLVATWQPGQGRRRARPEQAESHVGLDRLVEPLGHEQAARDPALVARQPPGDLGLVEAVLAVERAHQPGLLQLGEAVPVVQEGERDLGPGGIDVEGVDAQLGPAQRLRGTQSLEAIDDLQPALLRLEDRDGGELADAGERLLHPRHSAGLAEPQRGEPLAERLHPHHPRHGLAGLHPAQLDQGARRGARVARDTLSQRTTSETLSPSGSAAEGGA